MELKAIDELVNDKKERKSPKPSYRQLFGANDPSKKNKNKKKGNKVSKKVATKSKNSY